MNFCQRKNMHSQRFDRRKKQKSTLRIKLLIKTPRPKRKHFLLSTPYAVIYRARPELMVFNPHHTKRAFDFSRIRPDKTLRQKISFRKTSKEQFVVHSVTNENSKALDNRKNGELNVKFGDKNESFFTIS